MSQKSKQLEKLIKEIDKYFVNIIRLCDNPSYNKVHIRQVANDACSFLYLKQKPAEHQFCEDCEAKIRNAKDMEVVPICGACAKRLNKRTKIEVDNKYRMIAECKCGKQEICIKDLVNSYGYIEKVEWQCPVCWQMINLFVKEKSNEEKV